MARRLLEGLADNPADALRAVCDLDLSGLEVDPPRGFGRALVLNRSQRSPAHRNASRFHQGKHLIEARLIEI